jgi:hypothetical protein
MFIKNRVNDFIAFISGFITGKLALDLPYYWSSSCIQGDAIATNQTKTLKDLRNE